MPCHRSCKQFVSRSAPPTYDEVLHQNSSSSLHLSVGTYAARYQPYSLSYRFEGAYTDIPVPQTPAIVPQTGRFIVPPPYDLDDYIEYDGEGPEEEEETSDSDDDDDYDDEEEENNDDPSFTSLCLLVITVWIFVGSILLSFSFRTYTILSFVRFT